MRFALVEYGHVVREKMMTGPDSQPGAPAQRPPRGGGERREEQGRRTGALLEDGVELLVDLAVLVLDGLLPVSVAIARAAADVGDAGDPVVEPELDAAGDALLAVGAGAGAARHGSHVLLALLGRSPLGGLLGGFEAVAHAVGIAMLGCRLVLLGLQGVLGAGVELGGARLAGA